MLVLSRQRDESIMIGDKVVVTIVDIRGDKVRLGIEAPEEIPVHRQEVYEAIRRENRRAGQLDPPKSNSLDGQNVPLKQGIEAGLTFMRFLQGGLGFRMSRRAFFYVSQCHSMPTKTYGIVANN